MLLNNDHRQRALVRSSPCMHQSCDRGATQHNPSSLRAGLAVNRLCSAWPFAIAALPSSSQNALGRERRSGESARGMMILQLHFSPSIFLLDCRGFLTSKLRLSTQNACKGEPQDMVYNLVPLVGTMWPKYFRVCTMLEMYLLCVFKDPFPEDHSGFRLT